MSAIYKHIKAKVPPQWKYPFWFALKSPQRKIGWFTLLTDIMGIYIFTFRSILPKRRLRRISICTGLHNRSEHYLEKLLASLSNVPHKECIELSVFDCASNDVEDLETEIRKRWKGKLVFQNGKIPFNRSYSFNRAIEGSTSPIVFICDADISLPGNIVPLCNSLTGNRIVWYPIYFFLYNSKKKDHRLLKQPEGEWEQYGSRGIFACRKKDLELTGLFDEHYVTWGGEDTDLWERFHKHQFTVIRNRQRGMVHHWHRTKNPKYQDMNEDSR